jgi:hypothetical protein
MGAVIHYSAEGSNRTCNFRSYGMARTSDPKRVTCKRCLAKLLRAAARLAKNPNIQHV